jgi:hypothetical protein
MFPLSKPPRTRPQKASQKLSANPRIKRESNVPAVPTRRTFLRPIRSDKAPQKNPVTASAKEKEAISTPA